VSSAFSGAPRLGRHPTPACEPYPGRLTLPRSAVIFSRIVAEFGGANDRISRILAATMIPSQDRALAKHLNPRIG
jgi:hypothetical protein